jgi:hypothetical protein
MFAHCTVYDPDNWRPGLTLMINNEHKLPHLPINVDNLTFHNCVFDVLDLKWLDDESLTTLSIHACRIREIRGLSASLKTIHVHHSNIEYIELPPNLETLVIHVDDHDSYPDLSPFPETLKTLSLRMRHLHGLQPLPAGLTKLCTTGSGFQLPATLPPNLKELICSKMTNQRELPLLPASLTYLDCANGCIHRLPELPPRLVYLDCSANCIEGPLPALPSALKYLDCSRNVITALPRLPPHLRRLVCSVNNLRELPPLPASLRQLNFSANPIERYPYVYDPSMHILLSVRGRYYEVLGTEKVVLDGAKVFPPAIEPEIKELHYAAEHYVKSHRRHAGDDDDFDPFTAPHNEALELVLEVQRQVDTHAFLRAIKEELIAVTWHPRRVEAWCGVDFSDPASD